MPDIYGSIVLANTYFGERLDSRVWEVTAIGDRTKALIMATRAIDRLNFAGEKYLASQTLQFPRETDTSVPAAILEACYECAIAFLDGVDMGLEQENLGVVAHAYSGARTTYNEHFSQDHIRAGIPSAAAWQLLMPFLRDPREVIIRRVS